MADDIPDFPGEEVDTPETDGQIISRSLSSSRRGSAIPPAIREREQARKEGDSAWRKKIAEESLQIRKEAENTAKQSAAVKLAETRLSILEKQANFRQKQEELTHAATVFEELNALDYKDGRFPNLVADTFKRNPRALDNPRVAGYVDKLFSLHDQYLKDFRTDAKADVERTAATDAEAAAKAAGMTKTDTTIKADGVTTKFEAPKTPTEAANLAAINKRMKAEFDVDLGDVNNPLANMRRVNPPASGKKLAEKNGDPNGSHYAFDVKSGTGTRTVLIPVDRFKTYADEYAAAKVAPAATLAAPATTGASAPAPGQPAATVGNGTIITNKTTGERKVMRDGQWQPL